MTDGLAEARRLAALIREHWYHPLGERCACGAPVGPDRHVEHVAAAIIDSLAPAGLDAAWKEAEAALPEGWRVGILPQRLDDDAKMYRVVALVPEHGDPQAWADGPTPAAALRALAARLTAESGDQA